MDDFLNFDEEGENEYVPSVKREKVTLEDKFDAFSKPRQEDQSSPNTSLIISTPVARASMHDEDDYDHGDDYFGGEDIDYDDLNSSQVASTSWLSTRKDPIKSSSESSSIRKPVEEVLPPVGNSLDDDEIMRMLKETEDFEDGGTSASANRSTTSGGIVMVKQENVGTGTLSKKEDEEDEEAALLAALDAVENDFVTTATTTTPKTIPSGPVFDSRSHENEESIEEVIKSLQNDETLQELLAMDISQPGLPTTSISSSSSTSVGKPATSSTNLSQSVLETNERGQPVLRFFFTDIYEDPEASPGVVYLFGRVPREGANESVCVVVQNVSHHLFFLPALLSGNATAGGSGEGEGERGGRYSIGDVKNEVLSKMDRVVRNVGEVKFRVDRKKYAFEIEGIPTEEVGCKR